MKDKEKTKEQLIEELKELRLEVAELRKSEAGRKKAEQAAQEARQYAESIVATVREPLVILDKDLRVISANRSFYRTFEVAEEETKDRLIYELGNRQWDIPALRILLEKILPKNTRFEDYEVEHDFPTIGRKTMLLNARRVYREANKTHMILLAIEDITERRNKEKELKKYATQLQAANRELEAFAYSVSHDLRAPLRAVDGFSQVIVEDYFSKLDDEGRHILTVIRDSTRDMGQLIDDLLAFSHLGREEMTPSGVNMNECVEIALDKLKPAVSGRKLEFKIEELVPANADGAMIEQVFLNLLSNAIKFSRPRETAFIEVGGKTEGDQNVYYVKDNGVGFDMKYSDKLFQVFQRLHSRDEYEGTGVGLAIVQRIIYRHGGEVWAEGKVGEGATFYFSLPKITKQEGDHGRKV